VEYVLLILCLIILVPAIIFFGYNITLALISVFVAPRKFELSSVQRNKFAIVIPAHNEEDTIKATLDSCELFDYPNELYDLYIIADNCTDTTAEVVRSYQTMSCLERFDDNNRGKGYALNWALKQLVEKEYDAFIVLDADCILDAHALKIFDHELNAGKLVLQTDYVVANPDATSISYVSAVGFAMENDLYYMGKSFLGLAVFLRGTGMVFHRSVLERFPWGAFSIIEDTDYAITLYKNKLEVYLVPEVAVHSNSPETAEQLHVQRSRWASGNLQFGKTEAVKLLLKGIFCFRPIFTDIALTVFTLSKPLQILLTVMSLAVCFSSYLLVNDILFLKLTYLSLAILVGYFLYFSMGVFKLGITWRRLRLLLKAPLVVISLILINIGSMIKNDGGSWNKTPRSRQE
jgi:1,2-diacylglycerol 3-beta-glucosyltransferase